MTAFRSPEVARSPIAEEVLEGLSATPRKLPPKLFYDAQGSRLFEHITELPEYYLTRTERAIFEAHAIEIIGQAEINLTLVELGAGSASKTRILIEAGADPLAEDPAMSKGSGVNAMFWARLNGWDDLLILIEQMHPGSTGTLKSNLERGFMGGKWLKRHGEEQVKWG